jgi:hypothetical protein
MMEIGQGCNYRSYSHRNVSKSIRVYPPVIGQWEPSILARVKYKDTFEIETYLTDMGRPT